ncbi:response regulator [Leptolyngbya sp. FACHB-36]|nr:response regulator [Leptolyngbya sp. FACHB-36]MBD2022514.1 response regulator [Leptolyngbya sp. FACHB-36]
MLPIAIANRLARRGISWKPANSRVSVWLSSNGFYLLSQRLTDVTAKLSLSSDGQRGVSDLSKDGCFPHIGTLYLAKTDFYPEPDVKDWLAKHNKQQYSSPWKCSVCPPQGCRILVVDDVADNIFLLQTILESEGFAVDTALSGQSALRQIQTAPPDLVLLDVMMPDMNGYEVTQHIRQTLDLSGLPILLVTAFDAEWRGQGIRFGANDLICKPIDFDDLLMRVNTYLAA